MSADDLVNEMRMAIDGDERAELRVMARSLAGLILVLTDRMEPSAFRQACRNSATSALIYLEAKDRDKLN